MPTFFCQICLSYTPEFTTMLFKETPIFFHCKIWQYFFFKFIHISQIHQTWCPSHYCIQLTTSWTENPPTLSLCFLKRWVFSGLNFEKLIIPQSHPIHTSKFQHMFLQQKTSYWENNYSHIYGFRCLTSQIKLVICPNMDEALPVQILPQDFNKNWMFQAGSQSVKHLAYLCFLETQ